MQHQRVRIFVTGKVQGVFFRQTLKAVAKKNKVSGWVRNLKDGRVEAVLEGDTTSVGVLVEWAHAGPASARVKDVDIQNEEFTGDYTEFDVRY